MAKEFILIVVDHEKKTFSVEGPMKDDTRWNSAVVAAQDAGRDVRCFTAGEGGLNPDAVADRMHEQFPDYILVGRGLIVRPALS